MAKQAKKNAFIPQEIAEGVTRDEKKESPMDVIESIESVRAPGKWIKASHEEMAKYELEGKLVGYDASTGEVFLKS